MKLGIAAFPASLVLALPVRRKWKILLAAFAGFAVKKELDRKIPGIIQKEYEDYIESLEPQNEYLFAPEIRGTLIYDYDGSPIRIIQAFTAGIPMMEFMEPETAGEYGHSFVLKAGYAKRNKTRRQK